MTWKPHVTVAAVLERDGRFLMVEECISGKTVLNQPAGHLEEGETLVAAVIRETLEETAWHYRPEAVIGLYQWRHPQTHESFLRVAFAGTGLYHESGRTLDSEIERIVWMTFDEVHSQAERLRSPMVTRSLEDYLSGICYPLSMFKELA